MPTKKAKPKTVKAAYWAIFKGTERIYTGTFKDCWEFFVRHYGRRTVSALQKDGIRIGRGR